MPRMTINAYLGLPENWPVRENIKHTIHVMPNAKDIRHSRPGDPCACALTQCIKRVYGVPAAMVGGRWAYIPQRDTRGRYFIARVQATAATQKALRHYDETGEMPENGFTFIPVSASSTTQRHRQYNDAHRDRQRTRREGARPLVVRRKFLRHLPVFLKAA